MSEYIEAVCRHDNVDDLTLVDFFLVHLPVNLLSVDVLGLDQRPIPAPVEFCIRAIDAGLNNAQDIYDFLGISSKYGESLLTELSKEDYIGQNAFGQYLLLRRSKELLIKGGESSPIDKRIQILWDPIQNAILDRTLVYTKQRADSAGIIAPIAGAFAAPDIGALDISDINKIRQVNSNSKDSEAPSFEVIRANRINKTLGRYRQAILLLYKSVNREYTFRILLNGEIDTKLTTACANIGLAKALGIDRRLSTKPGVQAVKKRYNDLAVNSSVGANISNLVRKRSLLMMQVDIIDRRLKEELIDSLIRNRGEYDLELQEVNAALAGIPVVPARCHEVQHYLIQALKESKNAITITTTMPSAAKIDGELLRLMHECLLRDVRINIYISDKFWKNDPTLAALNKLSKFGHISVDFLRNVIRSVFEVEWDGKCLFVCNEPPLGNRRPPVAPRDFEGFMISNSSMASQYASEFLSFKSSDILEHWKPSSISSKNDKNSTKR